MSLYNLGLSQSLLRCLLIQCEKKSVSEKKILKLFGFPPYAFAGESTYKNEKLSNEQNIIVSPYKEFGIYNKSLKSKQNFYNKSLPKWMKKFVPFDQIGSWKDEKGREYKFEEDLYEVTDKERWNMRLPIALTRRKYTNNNNEEILDFPNIDETLILKRNKSQQIKAKVIDMILQRNQKSATASIILYRLDK